MIPVMKVAFKITCTRKTVTDDKGQVASPSLDCKWSVKSGIIINLQSGGPDLLPFSFLRQLLCYQPTKECLIAGYQWRIPGRGLASPLPLFLDQTEARRAENVFFLETGPPPCLKVWIRHWLWYYKHKIFIDKIKTFHQYVCLTVKRIKCKLIKLSHFKYPSARQDILYFLLLYFFYLVQANPVNSDIEGPWKVAM